MCLSWTNIAKVLCCCQGYETKWAMVPAPHGAQSVEREAQKATVRAQSRRADARSLQPAWKGAWSCLLSRALYSCEFSSSLSAVLLGKSLCFFTLLFLHLLSNPNYVLACFPVYFQWKSSFWYKLINTTINKGLTSFFLKSNQIDENKSWTQR